MAPTKELIAALHRERGEAATALTFEQRFLAGAELFDYACDIAKSSLRVQQPHLTDEQILDEIRRRIHVAQKLRERR